MRRSRRDDMTRPRDHATPRSLHGRGRAHTGANLAGRAAMAVVTLSLGLAPVDTAAQGAASAGDALRPSGVLLRADAVSGTKATERRLHARLRHVASTALALAAQRETRSVADTGVRTLNHETLAAPAIAHAATRPRASRAQEPTTRPRTVRGTIQGGMHGLGDGYLLGGGVAARSTNLVFLGDGNLIANPGSGSLFYGSGTLAYQFGSGAGVEPLVGAGMALLKVGNTSAVRLQSAIGLEFPAGFVQMRVLIPRGTVVMLMAGVRF